MGASRITIANHDYPLQIIKKNNKNTYIRVSNDLKIVVTTSYFNSTKSILKLIDDNESTIIKMINKKVNSLNTQQYFWWQGNKYNVIIDNAYDEVYIDNGNIYTKSEVQLHKFILSALKKIFAVRLNYCYNLFKEDIIYPQIKIRKMKTRWGVCNLKYHYITLNYELYKYPVAVIDYVIIHELSHLVVPNHSSQFWQIVSQYCPGYKQLKKLLKES